MVVCVCADVVQQPLPFLMMLSRFRLSDKIMVFYVKTPPDDATAAAAAAAAAAVDALAFRNPAGARER